MCRVIHCVVGSGCLLSSARSLGKTLLALSLLHFVFQGQTCLLLQVSLDFILLYSSPLWWKGHLVLMLVLESLVGLHRTIQLQLLCVWSINLYYCDTEWFALEMNRMKWTFCHFWNCTQVLHFGLFCWLWWLSISSKGFLLLN